MRLRFRHEQCEVLRQHRAEDGCNQHHDEDPVEHAAVEQRLTGGIVGPVRDEGGRERRRDLWQRERPPRSACCHGVTESRPRDCAAIHLPATSAAMTPPARKESCVRLRSSASGSIKKPVTMKKIGMNRVLPMNSSLFLAGLSFTAALTARPARNVPTIPGRLMY